MNTKRKGNHEGHEGHEEQKISRKGAKPQRNTGPHTTGRLTEKEKYPFFAPSLLCSLPAGHLNGKKVLVGINPNDEMTVPQESGREPIDG